MSRIHLFPKLLLLLVTLSGAAFSQVENKINRKLLTAIESQPQGPQVVAWIYFSDKGQSLSKKLQSVESSLAPNAYRRRLRTRGANNLVDHYDIPVNENYVQETTRRVKRIRHKSRWLNAVSVEAGGGRL